MADIIDLIQQDHHDIRAIFAELESVAPDRRGQLFRRIVAELARHEAAEQVIVHPALRHEARDDRAADALVEQEQRAEKLMAAMEGLNPASDDFLARYWQLRDDVLAHAEHEEAVEHPQLRRTVDAQRLSEMAEAFAKVRSRAPTRPHPLAPNKPGIQATLGPVVGIFDRARDSVRETLWHEEAR